MGNAQWIGHIMKRLHLIDERRRKRLADGIIYSVLAEEVRDMMRRYQVDAVTMDNQSGEGEA